MYAFTHAKSAYEHCRRQTFPHLAQLMSQSIHHSLSDAQEEEEGEQEEEEEEEEIWLLVDAALVRLPVAYTLKHSNISLCLSSNTLVESQQREDRLAIIITLIITCTVVLTVDQIKVNL